MRKEIPFQKSLIVCLFIICIIIILSYGSSFLIPITYGMMFAFLVNPVFSKLTRMNINIYLAAIASASLVLVFVLALLAALSWQIQQLAAQRDEIRMEMVEKQKKVQRKAKKYFGLSPSKQEDYAEKVIDNLENNIGNSIGSFASIITNFFLSLVYAILLLTEKRRIHEFFLHVFPNENKAENTIEETSNVIQSYLSGKLLIIGLLATTYAIGFSIAGIKYGILIAVLAAFLSFIPYAGNLIGAGLAALITFATGGTFTEILIIFGVMGMAQLVESYILEPWIVGSNVDLNPLFAIMGVVGFSLLWGAAGAIIALPLSGILKVFFDRIRPYQPLGFLMGNDALEEGA